MSKYYHGEHKSFFVCELLECPNNICANSLNVCKYTSTAIYNTNCFLFCFLANFVLMGPEEYCFFKFFPFQPVPSSSSVAKQDEDVDLELKL